MAQAFACSPRERLPLGLLVIPWRVLQERQSPPTFFLDRHHQGRLFVIPEASCGFLQTHCTSAASVGLSDAHDGMTRAPRRPLFLGRGSKGLCHVIIAALTERELYG